MAQNISQYERDARSLGARHRHRVILLIQISSAIAGSMCFGWMVYFLLQVKWLAALPFSVMVASSAFSYLFAGKGRIYVSGAALFISLYVLICGVCLVFDLPSAQAARTTHLFLLPVGAGAHMGLRGARPWLRYGVVTFFLFTFGVFASTNFGIPTPFALSDEVRIIGNKIDTAAATFALFMVMYVMQADVEARNAYEADLRSALDKRQLVVYYQPQVDASGTVSGAEALVRWIHPRRGMIAPGEFIPIAERTGLILPMGYWVLETACAHLKELAGQPHTAHITMAVNISAHQLRQADFVVQVLSIIERSGIDPHKLKLELTESVLVNNMDDTIAKMNALRKHGVSFSLDDFGTGYSSLSYLKRLPLDQLKIDQAFVRDLLTHPNDLAIARTVVDLGRTLQLSVIAEGVETEEQKAMLSSIDCNHFQGYLFGKPAPFEKLLELAAKQAAAAAPSTVDHKVIQDTQPVVVSVMTMAQAHT